MSHSEVAHLFFPQELRRENGYIIGYNIQGLIATIIHIDNEHSLNEIEERLNNSYIEKLNNINQGKLMVLGKIYQNETQSPEENELVQNSNIWIEMQRTIKKTNTNQEEFDDIIIKKFLICGYKYKVKTQIYLYNKLNRFELLSFNENTILNNLVSSHLPSECYDFDFNYSEILNQPLQQPNQEVQVQQATVRQINSSRILKKLLNKIPINKELMPFHAHLGQKISFLKFLISLFLFIQYIQLIFLHCTYWILNIPFMQPLIYITGIGISLQKQITHKLLAIQSQKKLIKQIQEDRSLLYTHPLHFYVQLLSNQLFILCDSLLGILIVAFLFYYRGTILIYVHRCSTVWHIQVMLDRVRWLMNFPMGLKINQQLTTFLGQFTIQVMYFSEYFTTFLNYIEEKLFIWVIFFCLFGLSTFLSLLSDLSDAMQMHLHLCYFIFRTLFNTIHSLIRSQYRMTQGLKFNLQKKKLEIYNYEWAQKIIALFLSSMLFFLLPCIGIYYIYFFLQVLIIFIIKVILQVLINTINGFPYALFIISIYYEQLIPSIILFDFDFKQQKKNYIKFESNISCHNIQVKKLSLMQIISRFFHSKLFILGIFKINTQFDTKGMIASIFNGQAYQQLKNKHEIKNFSLKYFKEHINITQKF